MGRRQIFSFLPSTLWHMLIALWATSFAFLVLMLIGMSHFFSNLFGSSSLSTLVEIAFFALSGVFALLLWRFFPRPQSVLMWFAACLPPVLIFMIFLA